LFSDIIVPDMPLTLYRRHVAACVKRRQQAGDTRTAAAIRSDRSLRRCSCPIHAEGALRQDGFIRVATGETGWERAEQWKAKVEVLGTLKEPQPEESADSSHCGPMKIADAIRQFTADARARHLDEETLKKYRVLFDQLTTFGETHGLAFLAEFDVPALHAFRATWKDKGISATKKLERLRSFFNFCTNAGWAPLVTPTRNGMRSAAHALRPPKEESRPTMPYSRDMMVRIIGAIERMPTRREERELTLRRLKLFIFVMRYGGLAIEDAATLTSDRVIDGRLFLYRAKTGVPVTVKLPDFVARPLSELPLYRGRYFFWNKQKENSKPATATGNWRRHLRKLLKLAGVVKPSKWAISHGFRDTFAVEYLNSGGSMEQLQILLGHKSIETTQEHYAPFDPSRAKKLDESVGRMLAQETWGDSATVH
jgi:integrase